MKTILCILGPTASGKSSLGLQLAELLGGEIVSCDSVQVFKGFDIGSSKATSEERTSSSSFDRCCGQQRNFMRGASWLADEAIGAITERGKMPIIVGGPNLYFRALLHGLSEAPEIPEAVQTELSRRLTKMGFPLYAELRKWT